MKTFTAPIQQNTSLQIGSASRLAPLMTISMRAILAGLSAAVVAVAITMLSVWAAGLEITAIAAAVTWGTGFVFLGLAVDNRATGALLQVASGVALLFLAWLQNTVSPEFIIVSGVLVATWLAAIVFRHVR